MYQVKIKKSCEKELGKMHEKVKTQFRFLVEDLEETGAIQKGWKNFSSLGKEQYHCHLSYS